MSYLDLPEDLSTVELQLRTMYFYYLEKGLNLSEPMYSRNIENIRDRYICENTVDPLFFLRRGKNVTGIVTTSEMFSFSNLNDVFVNKHMRYCPVPIHAHEYFEVMCVIKGECTVYIENNTVTMQTGDTMIVPPFVAHTISVFNDDCIVYNTVIRLSTMRSKFANLLFTKHAISDLFAKSFDNSSDSYYLVFRTGHYYLDDNKFGDVVHEFNTNQEYSGEMLNILTSAYLYDLLRKFSDTATLVTINDEAEIELAIIKYITEHMDNVTLTNLGKEFSYSNRQMSRIIKEKTGLLYSELVNKIRMENIAKMLVITDIPISKIMELSGISSASYFFKIFKSYFGETPQEYRNSRLLI